MLLLHCEFLGLALFFFLLLLFLEFFVGGGESRPLVFVDQFEEVKWLELVDTQLQLGVQDELGPGFDAS